ncbi:MAG TPA: hypothetical protein PKI41_09540 [Candidatus Competibacteraceae bacterium]|nr:hypothetical protein [Candidatus Competibacteraceae bacterium]HQD56180.1 hypothetical protein [Candidatus Competibacteraceae bacterium]
MPFPFESGWVDQVRKIDPNIETLAANNRLKEILNCFYDWDLFPHRGRRRFICTKNNCDAYFYFLWTEAVRGYAGNAYVGFLVPRIYERLFRCDARNQGMPEHSITSRDFYSIELVVSIANRYGFQPNNDDLCTYSGGPYRRAYIPGASEDNFGELWIVEFEDTWNCKEVWLEKTQVIRDTPGCHLRG